MPFFGMMCSEMHIMLVYRLILELLGVLVDPIVYSLPRCIFCVLSFLFFDFFFSFLCFLFQDFVGISSVNPHETLLIHLRETRGLKALLHTLNASVIPTKVS